MLDYQLLLSRIIYIWVMKKIVQKGLNYFLIGIFIVGSVLFFIQSRKKDLKIEELNNEITRMKVKYESAKTEDSSEIK